MIKEFFKFFIYFTENSFVTVLQFSGPTWLNNATLFTEQ